MDTTTQNNGVSTKNKKIRIKITTLFTNKNRKKTLGVTINHHMTDHIKTITPQKNITINDKEK